MLSSKYSVFDNMIEGVQLISPDWRYLYVNDAIAGQGKTTRESLLGRTMMECYPGIDETEVFAHIRKCMTERVASNMVNEFRFNDGTKGWFDLRLAPVEEGVLLLSFDITCQKELELALLQMNEELEKRVQEQTHELVQALNREKELSLMKSRFVSIASHEFRTPLSAILSSASLIEQYAETGHHEKRLRHTRRIKSAVGNLTTILGDFLSLEKLEEGIVTPTARPIDLPALICDILEETSLIAKKDQRINYTHEGENEVVLDEHMVHNVLLNLLSNAIKYSDKNIELRTYVTPLQVSFTVSDKGIGIPEADQENLFGKFFRAGNVLNIEGTGLGLNIVKRYVELMGGTIGFSSRQNEGSTFTVQLPGTGGVRA